MKSGRHAGNKSATMLRSCLDRMVLNKVTDHYLDVVQQPANKEQVMVGLRCTGRAQDEHVYIWKAHVLLQADPDGPPCLHPPSSLLCLLHEPAYSCSLDTLSNAGASLHNMYHAPSRA